MSKATETTAPVLGGAVLEQSWSDAIGEPAYASIVEMVKALDCDYDRLEELRDARRYWEPEPTMHTSATWETECMAEAEELRELEAAAGECESRDDALQRIHEDALSVEVRSAWHEPATCGDSFKPSEFRILLTTGGPAVQIRGELSEHGEPTRAWLEVQDWGKPWTQYFKADDVVLIDYANCFYFGEG